uniref:Uncharacterized protein n=1 Tax=Plectus sambesii TaxID=2011161 RepID=A0A914WKN7_9BILA
MSNGRPGWLIWIFVAIGVMYLLYLGITKDRPAYLVPFLAKMCVTAASFIIGGMFMFVSPFEDERHDYGPMTRVVAVVVITWGIAHIWFFKIVYKCFEHLKWKRAHEGIQVIP